MVCVFVCLCVCTVLVNFRTVCILYRSLIFCIVDYGTVVSYSGVAFWRQLSSEYDVVIWHFFAKCGAKEPGSFENCLPKLFKTIY